MAPLIDEAPLLAAKLLPPTAGPFHLARERLLRRLAKGIEGRATVVLAGPGYGKTSLVARFLQERGGESVWYWLDDADRDPWTFFRYLTRGLKEHTPEFGQRSEGLWRDSRLRSEEIERLADVFIRDAEESLAGPAVVVLDEVQHLEGSEPCVRSLRRLLDYMPGTLHLVLIARSLPDLGLTAMRAEGAINVIEGDELLFTLEETRVLLTDTFGLRIPAGTVERVHARTRGWVTALQLLRQTARLDAEAADLPEGFFQRTESEVFDYFSEEVLASEPPVVREFLMASSLPSVIEPDVCAQVFEAGDVREILARLLRRKLFISPLESRGVFYAYDPLFRDFLARRLKAEKGPAVERDLHRRWGRAFARRGDFTQALTHLTAAGDAAAAEELLARHGLALLASGMLETVRQAATWVAGRGVRSAAVEHLLGEACRVAGDHAAAIGHFETALAPAAGGGGGPLAGAARAGALQGLAYSLLKKGDVARAARVGEEALRQAEGEEPALLARVLNTVSLVRNRENRHQEALSGWQEALARARQASDDHLILMIAHNLGLPHAAMGDFARASECFQILTSPDNPRLGPEEGAAHLNLARIATIRGEHARAASLLGDAREIANRWGLQSLVADVLEAEGTLLRETGDLDLAREKYAGARTLFTRLGAADLLDNLAEEEAVLAARRGDRAEAETLALRAVESRRAAGDEEGAAWALLALGEVRVRAGDDDGAIEALSESSRLFGSLGRSFAEFSSDMWLSLASFRKGRKAKAQAAASRALAVAARFDYRAAVQRIAGLDRKFRGMLAALPEAPPYLVEREKEAAAPAPREVPAAAVSVAGADLTVRLLGPIEVYRDAAQRVPASAWKIRRVLQLFCYVASSRGRRATKDKIVDALWGDARLSVIEKNFHPAISLLRRALNHGHTVPKNFILFEKGAYLLNPAYRYDIDTETFEEKIRSARGLAARGDAAAALGAYEPAFALHRGPFLEEEYDEWAEAPRAHFASLHAAALREAGELHMKAGDPEAGLARLGRLVEIDPLDEEASSLLMRAHGSQGHRAAVEREFQRLSETLRRELDADALPETRRAYEAALEAAGTRAAPRPKAAGRSRAGR